MRLLMLATLALLGWASAAGAQPKPTEDIIVEGRNRKAFAALLEAMAPSRSGRQIARWDQRVCTRVFGLEAQHAAYVKARIDSIATDLKLGAAKSPKCTPDVLVLFALDADEVAADIVSHYPDLIGEVSRGAVNRRTKEVYLVPRPVRWFGQDVVKAEGLPIATRLRMNSHQTINKIVLLIDLNKLDGISWGQLADFLAVVSMSRPELEHVYTDGETILSLFTARDQHKPLPIGITPLDRSFLINLYRTEARRSPDNQQQDIRRHVKSDLARQHARDQERSQDR